MATPINATIVYLAFGAAKITHQLSADFKASLAMRESLTKDNDGYKAKFPGARDWEMTGEAEVAYDAAQGFEELFDAFMAGTVGVIDFVTDLTGETGFTGNAIITDLSITAGVEDNAKMTYTFKGSGAIAPIVVVAPEGEE
jgi:predicted secreted protein